MEQICQLFYPSLVGQLPWLFGLFLLLFGLILFFFLVIKFRFFGLKLLFLFIIFAFHLFLSTLYLTIFGLITTDFWDNPIAGKYFEVNGEVKLACLYPGPTNDRVCPQTKDQVVDLKLRFKTLLLDKAWEYHYFPTENEYTLIIKDNNHRGAIFDPLLKKLGSLDLAEIQYDCAGNIVTSYIETDIWDQYKTIRQNDIPALKSSRVVKF